MIVFVPAGGWVSDEEVEAASSFESFEVEVVEVRIFLVPGGVPVAVAIAAEVDFMPSEEDAVARCSTMVWKLDGLKRDL